MKKTLKINISGVVFTIDDDAYARLQNYLTEINSHFARQEGGKEIIADIESRIAELFQAGISDKKEVINLDDVNEVIHIMGDPRDLLEDEEQRSRRQDGYVYESHRRLYRDPENAVIGGVCGGLGAYFNLDPVWIRLMFVLALILQGFGLLVYAILWIVVPAARSTSQKLEMKGEKVTVQSIEKSVREEFDKVKENLKNVPDSRAYRQARSAAGEVIHVIGQVLVAIIKVVLVIIGVGLVIAGIALLIAMVTTLVYNFSWAPFRFEGWGPIPLPDIAGFFADPRNLPVMLICLFFTLAIPIFALIYGGIKLMFRIKTNDRVVGVTALVLWIITTVTLVSLIVVESKHFREQAATTETVKMEPFVHDTLFIRFRDNEAVDEYEEKQWFFDEDLPFIYSEPENTLYGKISLDIKDSEQDYPELRMEKSARGDDEDDAIINAGEIQYQWKMEGCTLLLDPYFSLPEARYWRSHDLHLRLAVPTGKIVYLCKGSEEYLDEVDNTEGAWNYDLTDRYWKMTDHGLAPARK